MTDPADLARQADPTLMPQETAMTNRSPLTDSLVAPVVRIVLRYVSGALIAWGVVAPDAGPDLIANADLETLLTVVLGGVIGIVTEWFYARARKDGGPT